MKIKNRTAIVCALALIAWGDAQAQNTYTRQNNTTALNLAGAWSAGGPPTGTDIAMWDATCGANVGTALGGSVTWGQILLTNNVGNAVTIANTASSTLILNGVSEVGIDMSGANQNLTINNPVTLGGTQTWNVASGRTLTVSQNYIINNGGFPLTIDGSGSTTWSGINQTTATLTGSGGLTKNGSGRFSFAGNNTGYSGTTTLNGGVTIVTSVGSIGSGNLTLNGGVYEENWTANFTRGLGAGPGQVQILGGTSGFGENGSTGMTINFGGTNEVQWDSAFFAPSTLVLQEASAQANSTLDFQDGMDLNGATRTLAINKTSVGSGFAKISGLIRTSSGTAGIIKTGPGILILSANNTYNGSTTISGGVVDFGGITLGFGSGRDISVAAGAAVMRTALNNAFLNRLVETSNEIGLFTGSTANNLDFSSSTGANLPNAFLGNWAGNGAKSEYSGTLTPASDNYRLGAKYSNGLLGIVGANKLTGTQGLLVGGTGASGIRVELAAAQNFTGDTIVNTGARLSLGNNLALQNSVFDVGAAGGNFSLAAGTNAGKISGETASPSPTFGGLKGSRNLLSVFSAAGGNNETLLTAATVIGFTLNPGTGVTCTYSGVIENFTNGTTITKSGAGTQIFSGANTYSGATTVNAGVLSLGHALALQNSPLNTTGSVTGDANNGLQTTVTTLTLGGLTGNNNLADLFTTSSGGYGSVTDLTLKPGTGATPSYSGIIADGATGMALIKSGVGTQILSGAHAYTGGTFVNAGTLLVNSPGSLAASSAVTIAGGALLGGDGTINGTVTVSNNGTLGGNVSVNGTVTALAGAILSPAGSGSVGTNTLANAGDALTLNGSTLNFDLPSSGTVCDLIAITGNLVVNGVNTVNISGPSGIAAGTYTLMTYGTTNGLGSIVFPNGATTMGNLTLTAGATSLTLTVGAGGYNANVWKGTVNGLWDTATANWARNGVAGQTYADGDAVTIDDTATATTITNSLSVSPAAVTVNNSAKNFTVTAILGGTGTPLVKSGSGTLTLGSSPGYPTNTYSGGTVVNAGILELKGAINTDVNYLLGAAAGGLTLNGGQLKASGCNVVAARSVTVGGGVESAIFVNKNNNFTTSGKLTGSGTLKLLDGGGSGTLSTYNFNSTANDFIGGFILNNAILSINSMTDTANNIVFTTGGGLTYGSSAVVPLTFGPSGRAIEINSAATVAATLQNNSTTQPITINTALVASGAGAKTLALGAVAGPLNRFTGAISDGTGGGTVAISKSGAGKWALSGINTFSGTITLNNNNPAGPLIFQGIQALPTTVTSIAMSDNSSANCLLKILDDGAGTVSRTGANVTFALNQTSANGTTAFFVGNNSTANDGSNPGSTQTGSTIALGQYISNPANTQAPGETINITGANSYRLQFASAAFTASKLAAKTAGSTFTMKWVPTSAPLTLAGGVSVGAIGNANCTPSLNLDGTASGNQINGVIADPTDAPGTSKPLTLTKSSSSTWTLSGESTYSGATAISGGILSINSLANVNGGASALGTPTNVVNGTIAIGSTTTAGTLQYTGSGHASDRVINLAGTTGGVTLDAAGAGALVLTTNLTATGAGSKTLTLAGASTATNTLGGAIVDNSAANKTSLIKTDVGTWVLSGSNTYTGTTSVRVGTLTGVTGGSCLGSSVTVTNTPGNASALAIRVTDTNAQWSCANLAFTTNGLGAQLKFSFAVAPSKTLAPLSITNNLAFTGAPVVVLNTANVPEGTYPLLVAGGTAPTAIPALDLMGSTLKGTLAWGGAGNKTLYLSLVSTATVITFF